MEFKDGHTGEPVNPSDFVTFCLFDAVEQNGSSYVYVNKKELYVFINKDKLNKWGLFFEFVSPEKDDIITIHEGNEVIATFFNVDTMIDLLSVDPRENDDKEVVMINVFPRDMIDILIILRAECLSALREINETMTGGIRH